MSSGDKVITPSTKSGDHVRWKWKKNGDFDIHSYYNMLRLHSCNIFPWKDIWGVKASKRVSFFV